MPIEVRPATPAQSADVAEIAARTFALACPPTAEPSDIAAFIATNLSAATFAAHIADPDRRVALATSDGSVVGYTMLIFSPPAEDVAAQLNDSSAVELSKIYVDPGHHGGGVAKALFDAALEQVTAGGRSSIWLGTNQANERAQRFYVKSGFQRVGTKRFRLGDNWEDDYIYERLLTARSAPAAAQPPN